MRLALLSNVTVDLLAGTLKKSVDVFVPAGFDTWQQELMMDSSALYAYQPEAMVLLFHANAFSEIWQSREQGKSLIDGWLSAVQFAAQRMPGVPLFISSLDVSNIACHYGAEIRNEPYFENYFIEKVEALHDVGMNIYVLPVKDIISDLGRNSFYSPKMWYMGSMPYSMKGISALGELILRYVSAVRNSRKKCIAVDLDNTLWGGVIGEDGVEGIVLSNNKEGARFKDAQRVLKKMREQGVMLAILSKNNPEDVEPVFRHPDMLLKHEDFVAEVINWEPKPANLRQLAKDLNIGIDSFVFLDDNPAEREQMKAVCPEVTVLDFPRDTSLLPQVLEKAYEDLFFALEVTGEDVKKTAMYRAESQRKAEMTAAASVEDYLRNLEMTMDLHLMRPEEEKRVTQLTNKTNQFNVTTKRYSEEEIHHLAEADDSDIITVHMADKYGDQGLVAVLILKYLAEEAVIDTFLMSCRVMGREAEKEIMSQVKKLLLTRGVKTVTAAYIRTAKNTPVEMLYEKLGFSRVSGNAEDIGDRKNYAVETAALPEGTGLFNQ